MKIKEEVLDIKKEVQEVKKQSLAMELLKDYKKANKRLFTMWVITFIAFIGLLGYTLWLQNDIGTYEDTITQQNDNGYNNYIGNNGDITNGKTSD